MYREQTMTKKRVFLLTAVFLLSAVGLFAQAGGKVYKIGETGPAGGIVFYDRGFEQDGWRYLEVAPIGAEKSAIWAKKQVNVPGATDFSPGGGKQNTQAIVEALEKGGETGTAAQICASLDINGFNDWFLPSVDELKLLYQERTKVPGLQSSRYWSSTQKNKKSAVAVDFNDALVYTFVAVANFGGTHGDNNKSDNYRVRPVRAF